MVSATVEGARWAPVAVDTRIATSHSRAGERSSGLSRHFVECMLKPMKPAIMTTTVSLEMFASLLKRQMILRNVGLAIQLKRDRLSAGSI